MKFDLQVRLGCPLTGSGRISIAHDLPEALANGASDVFSSGEFQVRKILSPISSVLSLRS